MMKNFFKFNQETANPDYVVVMSKKIRCKGVHASLDYPVAKFDESSQPIAIQGWAFGDESFQAVELVSDNMLIARIPFSVARPDVLAHFEVEKDDDVIGFFNYLNPFLLPENFSLLIRLVRDDGTYAQIYTITGSRPRLPLPMVPPLCVTTLGRTGSTALLGYLGCHPEVSVYKPFQAEARYISYWSQMFESLSSGMSWQVPLDSSSVTVSSEWMLGCQRRIPRHYGVYPEMFAWFNKQYIPDVYRFCMASLCEHYQHVARLNGGKSPSWMVEKFLPDLTLYKVKNLIPTAKELILVRDFRDVYNSILAFIAKRGESGFGRNQFEDDRSYLAESFIPSVKQLHRHWKEDNNQALLVRYEDLIQKPNETMKKICAYLSVDESDACIEATLKKASELGAKLQKKHQTSDDAASSIGRFEGALPAEDVAYLEEELREALSDFGYL